MSTRHTETIEVTIPDGYTCKEYSYPNAGDVCLSSCTESIYISKGAGVNKKLILEKNHRLPVITHFMSNASGVWMANDEIDWQGNEVIKKIATLDSMNGKDMLLVRDDETGGEWVCLGYYNDGPKEC